MIAVDTNLLVYAYDEGAEEHGRALVALERLTDAGTPWGVPWTVAAEFLGVVTNERIVGRPLPIARALDALDVWLEDRGAVLLAEPAVAWPRFRDLLLGANARGPFVHDARIAAACLANGVSEFWTADRDYGRFPGLRVVNPLVG